MPSPHPTARRGRAAALALVSIHLPHCRWSEHDRAERRDTLALQLMTPSCPRRHHPPLPPQAPQAHDDLAKGRA